MQGFMKCWWTNFLAHFFVCVFVLGTWGVSIGLMGVFPVIPWFFPLILEVLLVYPFVLWYGKWRGKKEGALVQTTYPVAYVSSYVVLHLFDYYMMYGLMQLQKVFDTAVSQVSGEFSTWLAPYLGDFAFLEDLIGRYVVKLAGLTWKVPSLLCAYLFLLLMLGVALEFSRVKSVRSQ